MIDLLPMIAVIDDSRDNRETLVEILKVSERRAVPIADPAPTIDGILQQVRGLGCGLIISDHVLSQGWRVNYHGAEIVEAGYRNRIPSLLISEFVGTQRDWDIRMRRADIPVVLKRSLMMEEGIILRSLDVVRREMAGDIVPERRPYATIFHVEQIVEAAGGQRVEVKIPAWNNDQIVELDARQFPDGLRDGLAEGVVYRARINLRSENPNDLFFRDIVAVPAPDLDRLRG